MLYEYHVKKNMQGAAFFSFILSEPSHKERNKGATTKYEEEANKKKHPVIKSLP